MTTWHVPTKSEDQISHESIKDALIDELRAEVARLKKSMEDRWYECHDGSEQACCKSHE